MSDELVYAAMEPVSRVLPASLATMWRMELRETLRARWYQVYLVAFVALMGAFFAFGLAESSIMGFHGLGRLLLTFIQLVLLILPIFVLVTTARTLVGDRESGVWEYMLSLPVSFRGYFWGRMGGRGTAMIVPLVLALFGGAMVEVVRGNPVPWEVVVYYAVMVVSLTVCFLGIAMALSVVSVSQEMAVGVAFVIWLASEGLVDAVLLGLLIRQQIAAEWILGIAMLNPLQAFRTAAVVLLDPELKLLGPLSYTLHEELGRTGMLAWAIAWPVVVGLVSAGWGAWRFSSRDVV